MVDLLMATIIIGAVVLALAVDVVVVVGWLMGRP
jgi:hypothetical protein